MNLLENVYQWLDYIFYIMKYIKYSLFFKMCVKTVPNVHKFPCYHLLKTSFCVIIC